jgi:hypothetical protein
MTREQAQKNAAAIKAFGEGKHVQIKLMDGTWRDTEEPFFESGEFRVKPEPREFWVPSVWAFYSKKAAIDCYPQSTPIHVREVC